MTTTNPKSKINLNDVDIHALPAVRISHRKRLLKCAGIYFLLEQDLLVYVGKSINLRHRWRQHHKIGLVQEPLSKIAWLTCLPKDLSSLEYFFVSKFSPKLNIQKVSKASPPSWIDLKIFEEVEPLAHPKKKKLSITVSDYIGRCIEAIAKKEGNTPSSMAAIILEETIQKGIESGIYKKPSDKKQKVSSESILLKAIIEGEVPDFALIKSVSQGLDVSSQKLSQALKC